MCSQAQLLSRRAGACMVKPAEADAAAASIHEHHGRQNAPASNLIASPSTAAGTASTACCQTPNASAADVSKAQQNSTDDADLASISQQLSMTSQEHSKADLGGVQSHAFPVSIVPLHADPSPGNESGANMSAGHSCSDNPAVPQRGKLAAFEQNAGALVQGICSTEPSSQGVALAADVIKPAVQEGLSQQSKCKVNNKALGTRAGVHPCFAFTQRQGAAC